MLQLDCKAPLGDMTVLQMLNISMFALSSLAVANCARVLQTSKRCMLV